MSEPIPITSPKKKNKTGNSSSLLDLANDWVLLIDIDKSLVFPTCTGVVTAQRPDIIIYSAIQKIIIWGELTVPNERRLAESAFFKMKRYLNLEVQLSSKGWRVHAFTWEIGVQGYPAYSVNRFFKSLGFSNSRLKHLINRLSRIIRRSSYWIYNARYSSHWCPPTLIPYSSGMTSTPTLSAPLVASHLSPSTSENNEIGMKFLNSNFSLSPRINVDADEDFSHLI